MSELKKRIFIDLISDPFILLPTTIGISLLFLAAILGKGIGLLGLIGLLAGIGIFFSNLILNFDKLSEQALKQIREKEKSHQDANLDALDAKLIKTKGTDDQNALRSLRSLYDSFSDDLQNKRISSCVPLEMLNLVDEIFHACIQKLHRSYDIYQMAQKVNGKLQKDLQKQRSGVLNEVEQSIEKLTIAISEVRTLGMKAEQDTMQELRSRLEMQLEVAKATEESVAALTKSTDMNRFSEYEK